MDCRVAFRGDGRSLCSFHLGGRKNDGRACQRTNVDLTIFADDTTLHGLREELHQADGRGPAGIDVFAQAISQWGSCEHDEKREVHTYGTASDVCLVGGGIAPTTAVNRNIQRGLKCWAKLKPALKGTRLSHKQRGRVLMTFIYSPLAFSCKTRATRQRDYTRLQLVMNTACRYVCRTRLSRMREQGINHNDLRAMLGIPPVMAAMEREQMRWLGHISRMQAGSSRTYAKTFARGSIDVGDFQRVASSAGGRIQADRRSLPELWVILCHKHGFCEDDLERLASNPSEWRELLDKRLAQAMYEDRKDSHKHQPHTPGPGVTPWVRPAGSRQRSPTAHEARLAQQRARRAGLVNQNPPAQPGPAPRPEPVAPHAPRQVRRDREGKVYYTGHNQRRVDAAEKASWSFVCDFPGCGLRFETQRNLNIHKGKASKPGGTHTLLG